MSNNRGGMTKLEVNQTPLRPGADVLIAESAVILLWESHFYYSTIYVYLLSLPKLARRPRLAAAKTRRAPSRDHNL